MAAVASGCGGSGDSAGQAGDDIDAAAIAALRDRSAVFDGVPANELLHDGDALALAGDLFAVRCAACHTGANAKRGTPDLETAVFDYGSDLDALRTTIAAGRTSTMPPMGSVLGEVEIGQIVSYVQALAESDNPSGGNERSDYDVRGQSLYNEHCVACHGPTGAGVTETGGPNLRDGQWQHGGSMMNIRLAITRGLESQCPGAGPAVTAAEVELLAAWVMSLRGEG